MDELIKGLKALFKLTQEMRDLQRANDAQMARVVALLEEQNAMLRKTYSDAVGYPSQKAG